MRVLELFGGYGSQALALENLGIDFKSDLCEIDKYAIKAYNQLHGYTFNYGNICDIDETKMPYYDLITYSSPCQDFSQAGKQAGGEKGSGTRSSLLWECERIIQAVKPKYLLMENVKALTSKKFMPLFQQWLNRLDELGYTNYWQVLNAKDYGVPQNRERVFVVSIRKDIEQGYCFPDKIPLEKRLKDVLESAVDEKYYISDKLIKRLPYMLKKQYSMLDSDVAGCETARQYANWNGNYVSEPIICASRGRNPDNPSDRTVGVPTEQRLEINSQGISNTLTSVQKDNLVVEPQVKQLGCSPALNTMQGGGLEPKIVEVIGSTQKNAYHGNGDISPALTSAMGMGGGQTPMCKYDNLRIRKLTPKECLRLMGVKDEQFDKLSGISNSQLYKLAGNSIVVDVLMAIFRNLFINKENKIKNNLFD